MDNSYTVHQSALVHFITADTRSAPFWLLVRVYLGWQWLHAGYEKLINPAWFGTDAGAALNGFVQNALSKTTGAHPDVQMWYASFLEQSVSSHLTIWSNAVVIGEIAIGLGLIVGLFTATAAFFGLFMNLNFMLSGAVSINPIMMVLAIGIMSAHRIAGYWGLDRYAKRLGRSFRMSYRTA
jgi:thiosulfate dehydrogenase (quinone) large subunit